MLDLDLHVEMIDRRMRLGLAVDEAIVQCEKQTQTHETAREVMTGYLRKLLIHNHSIKNPLPPPISLKHPSDDSAYSVGRHLFLILRICAWSVPFRSVRFVPSLLRNIKRSTSCPTCRRARKGMIEALTTGFHSFYEITREPTQRNCSRRGWILRSERDAQLLGDPGVWRKAIGKRFFGDLK
jgi:hypothetical protein